MSSLAPSLSVSQVVPLNPSFSGHETFVFRYAWLKKGVDAFAADPEIFRKESAIVTLGVGKNMVSSIRHWCIATRLFEETEPLPGSRIRPLQISRLGKFLFQDDTGDGEYGYDSFLEDDATLWLLHWNLAANTQKATTWHWAFNQLRESEFTRASLMDNMTKFAAARGWPVPSESSLKNDISCFLRTYLPGRRGVASTPEETMDCPLATLGLIIGAEGGSADRLRFNNRPKPNLPPVAFAYALLEFWDARHASQSTLSLREIVHGEGSPGRVFRIDEDTTLDYLDTLDALTEGKLNFVDTALVRQVARRDKVDSFALLKTHYATR